MIEEIVITGSSCSDTSAALPIVKRELEKNDYHVLINSECAADMLNAETGQNDFKNTDDFVNAAIERYCENRQLLLKSASRLNHSKVVIIHDRGISDYLSLTDRDNYRRQIAKFGLTPVVARDSYGAVFYMLSTAKANHEQVFSNDTHCKSSTLDDKTLNAWVGHPHLRIIDCCGSFDEKIGRLIAEIKGYLGIPRRLEIERRFLIRYPDLDRLNRLPNCKKAEIEQIYCVSKGGEPFRIRKRGIGDDCIYIKTLKRSINDTVREEYEDAISKDDYGTLSSFADKSRNPIIKSRYCLAENGKYFEIDIFPFWNDRAIFEIELLDSSEAFDIPDYFDVIKEITAEKKYRNSALAVSVPYENII